MTNLSILDILPAIGVGYIVLYFLVVIMDCIFKGVGWVIGKFKK